MIFIAVGQQDERQFPCGKFINPFRVVGHPPDHQRIYFFSPEKAEVFLAADEFIVHCQRQHPVAKAGQFGVNRTHHPRQIIVFKLFPGGS